MFYLANNSISRVEWRLFPPSPSQRPHGPADGNGRWWIAPENGRSLAIGLSRYLDGSRNYAVFIGKKEAAIFLSHRVETSSLPAPSAPGFNPLPIAAPTSTPFPRPPPFLCPDRARHGIVVTQPACILSAWSITMLSASQDVLRIWLLHTQKT